MVTLSSYGKWRSAWHTGVVSEVQAATAGTPSVDTFATKSQLMNNFDLERQKGYGWNNYIRKK